MIITVEGPDNAGKTTLGMVLAKKLNALYIKAERPRAGPVLLEYQAIIERAISYSGKVVTDRHVAISEPIYGPICRGRHDLNEAEIDLCLTRVDWVVYCRPPIQLILGTLGKRDQMDGVVENGHKIINAYDHWFREYSREKKPRLIAYDYMSNHLDLLIDRLEGRR